MTTPLPRIDRVQVAEFWARCLDAAAVASATSIPAVTGPFGDSVKLADELINLVVNGSKRAMAAAVAAYVRDGDPLPSVGQRSIATDGTGRARALVVTTDVRIGPLSSGDEAFAWDEGEGDRSLGWWIEAHDAYFRRESAILGYEFSADLPVVFSRFAVPYVE